MMEDILTDQEIQTLILALGDGRGEEGFTEEEAEFVVSWARGIKIGHIMLEFILSGTLQAGTHAVVNVVQKVNVATRDVVVAIHDDDHVISSLRGKNNER